MTRLQAFEATPDQPQSKPRTNKGGRSGVRKLKVTETDIKNQIKGYLNIRRIFNYPLLQGIASYKGLPDRVMHLNGHAIYLEAKKPGGKLSPHQEIFQAQCQADGIPYWVVHSLDELIERIEEVKND